MRPAFLLCLTLLLATTNSATAIPLGPEEVQQLKKSIEAIKVKSLHPLAGGAAYQYGVGFDPSVLSSKDVRFVYAVTKDKQGNPELNPVISNGTDADRFYCEQAIWETYPLAAEDKTAKYTLYELDAFGPVKAKFTEFTHHGAPDKVRMHLIPAYVLRYPDAYNKLFHSNENVAEIDQKKINDPALGKFRTEWTQFLLITPKPSIEALVKERRKLRIKYKALFLSK